MCVNSLHVDISVAIKAHRNNKLMRSRKYFAGIALQINEFVCYAISSTAGLVFAGHAAYLKHTGTRICIRVEVLISDTSVLRISSLTNWPIGRPIQHTMKVK